MTRKRLALLVGVGGFLAACASLVLLLVMGSLFADARTEHLAGPGVDVFVRTPFPTEGSTVVLDVEARGGSRAGVRGISIASNGEPIAHASGSGSYMAHRGRSRGSDTETISFSLPLELRAGDTLPIQIDVDYVVSQRGSSRSEGHHGRVALDIRVYSSTGRLVAQLARLALAFGCFGFWFLLVWGIAKLYAQAGDGHVGRDAAETEGIGLLMGFLGGSILGYWLFAWRIMNALELVSTWWAVLLMTFWCVAPLVHVRRWWKRRKNRAELPAARVVAR